jgi:Glycosyl hydrolase family 65, N-terminal domain
MITRGCGTLSALLAGTPRSADTGAKRLVWFDTAATHFTQSCPLGNGRLGVMVIGGVDEERVVLKSARRMKRSSCDWRRIAQAPCRSI